MSRTRAIRGDSGGAKRTDWIESLDFEVPVITGTIPDDIEYLYWVGCAGALDERARKGAQATARMLHRAGVTLRHPRARGSPAPGDPVRRLGNEYLYQEQAAKNIETLNGAGVKKVIATCPHCFNSLANEYPALGGNFEVIHHSQLLDHLVQAGRLTPGGGYAGSVTYHDPCYLGRHNRVFDEPRSVIDAIPGATQIEMRRCREKGFCCGAGGARMWLEENIGTRVNMDRTDEAIGTGADVVSTACPYCMIMLDDAVRANAKEDDVRVLDLSQLLEESMGDPVSRRRRWPCSRRGGSARRDRDHSTDRGRPQRPVLCRIVSRTPWHRPRAAGWPVRRASCGRWWAPTRSRPLNWRCDMTSTSMSVSDTTEAERGRRSSRASSPKWLPAPERGDLLAVAGHRGLTLDDDEELLADVALLDQDLARRHRHLVQRGPDLAQLRSGAAGEQPDGLEVGRLGSRRHGARLTGFDPTMSDEGLCIGVRRGAAATICALHRAGTTVCRALERAEERMLTMSAVGGDRGPRVPTRSPMTRSGRHAAGRRCPGRRRPRRIRGRR